MKNGPEVMALLNALQLPAQVAILKMKAHGKIFTGESKGNDLADRERLCHLNCLGNRPWIHYNTLETCKEMHQTTE